MAFLVVSHYQPYVVASEIPRAVIEVRYRVNGYWESRVWGLGFSCTALCFRASGLS